MTSLQPFGTSSLDKPSSKPRWLGWWCGAVLGVAFATLIGSNLPERVKVLGLFPIVWGGLVGWGLHWWTREQNIRNGLVVLLSSLILIATGEAGLVVGRWVRYRQALITEFHKIPDFRSLVPARTRAEANTSDPAEPHFDKSSTATDASQAFERTEQEIETQEQSRRAELLQFSRFLQLRIAKALGTFSTPWPELFLCSEIVFGTVAGWYGFQHGKRNQQSGSGLNNEHNSNTFNPPAA